ncbi:HARBI1 [Mytilus coruscus]|uniref:HARBI1 n=1 Tax=Mytilus coruscus TaxID=42192 RepID=A0A6J8B894_MYTCO|nr:HARBI1 [Mytilus coruscus]
MAAIAMFYLPRVRGERHYRGFNPLNKDFSDEQLRQKYWFDRETIQFVANELRGDLEESSSTKTALKVEQQVVIALRFYGSGRQMQVVGNTMGFDTFIRMKPEKACRIITACAVLHNIAILRLETDVDGEQEEDVQPAIPPYVGREDGQGIRDHLEINFFYFVLM